MVSAAGSDLPGVLSGRICAYCFEKGSVLVIVGCESGCVYDYVFCETHVFMLCAQFNTHEMQVLPCRHEPLDLIYSYPHSDYQRGKTFNSDGIAV